MLFSNAETRTESGLGLAGRLLLAGTVWLGACGNAPEDSSPVIKVVAAAVDLRSLVRVQAASDDSLWLVWSQAATGGETVTGARVDATTGLVSRGTVSPAPSDGARQAQIVIAGAVPLVAWLEITGAETRAQVASWSGVDWTIEKTLSSVAGFYDLPRLTAGHAGEAHLTWAENSTTGGSRLLASRRVAAGSWSAPTVIRSSPGTFAGAARLAPDPDGELMAVWAEPIAPATAGPPWALWAARFDASSGAWTSAVQLDSDTALDAQLAAYDSEQWMALWLRVEPSSTRRALWATRFVSGAWDRTATRVDTAAFEDPAEPALSWSGAALHAAWTADAADFSARRSVRAAKFDRFSNQWTSPALVNPLSASLPAGPHLQHARDGRAGLSWGTQSGAGDPSFAQSDAGGSWKPAIRLEQSAFNGNAPDLTALASGGWATTWYRSRGDGTFDIVLRRVP